MANIQIRKYQEEDSETVKELFTSGMNEHLPSAFVHLLKQPLTHMLLMCTFCSLVATSKSFLLPVLAVALLLAAGRQAVVHMFNAYIGASLKSDLDDVVESYLRRRDSCFWVAESDGRVVGTVACLPAENAPEFLELKRMSVCRSHRGKGIAKALCRTVADFARDRGYPAVILYTSMVATDAQRLYERVGYKKIRQFPLPDFFPKIINFTLIEYKLDLERDK
uniref:N-acetyltransferase 8 n=1 Tax=Fundulus heteroclitus TaxID=8078 RepID=A0A3Q2QKD2_FUNHE